VRTQSGKPDLRYLLGRVHDIIRPPVDVSPLPEGIVFEKDVAIPLSDGVKLAANVYRPSEPGKYPVVMCAHPYGKDTLFEKTPHGYKPIFTYRIMRQPSRVAFSDQTGWEGPDPARWVLRGYVVVNVDLRGFHHSEGAPGVLLSDQEARDYFEAIEWAAMQPWSTGAVGLNGVSYLAIAQWKVAALNPPHLKAICPWEGLSDMYKDLMYPGGVREDGFANIWGNGVKSGVNVRIEQMKRTTRDEWFQSLVPDLGKITVPALICGSFSDQCLHTRGSFRAFEQVGSRHKWLYTHRSGKWATYYGDEALAWQFRFFDHFLKGEANGMDSVPPVRLAVHSSRTEFTVRAETQWPPRSVIWKKLYLNGATRTLETSAPDSAVQVSFPARTGQVSFLWTIPQDLELVGSMELVLPISLAGANDANLFVAVRKVVGAEQWTFEGSYGFSYDMVTKGWMRTALRRVNEAQSRPGQPDYDFAIEEPLQEGELASLRIALLPSATAFRAGDQLQMDLRGSWFFVANPLVGAGPAAYLTSSGGTVTVHTGEQNQAYLLIPEISEVL